MSGGQANQASAPEGCTRPEVGCWADAYLEGSLPEEKQDEFERHYFRCPACLRAIQLHQDLIGTTSGGVGVSPPERHPFAPGLVRVPWWGWATGALAAGLAAFLLLGPLIDRSGEQGAPYLLRLEGTFRESANVPTAPAGRDLRLVLPVSVPKRAPVAYDVEVKGAGTDTAFVIRDAAPSGPSEVSVLIPRDVLAPGRYDVTLREKGTQEPLVLHFSFTVQSTER